MNLYVSLEVLIEKGLVAYIFFFFSAKSYISLLILSITHFENRRFGVKIYGNTRITNIGH